MRLTASPSPITAATTAISGLSFSNLRCCKESLYFACRDPKNEGRTSVLRISMNETTPVRLTPKSVNVASSVHEYGGGAFCVDPEGAVVYSESPSNAVFRVREGEEPTQVMKLENCRFADFFFVDSKQPYIVAVMEDHTNSSPSNVKNSVVAISLTDQPLVTTLASGHDFFSSPQMNNKKTKLVYIAWDHPNMPWDTTWLYVQSVENGKPVGEPEMFSFGSCQSSMMEPRWQGDDLLFFSDESGWYNLYQWRISRGDGNPKNLLPVEADFTEAPQGWVLGLSPYTVLCDGSTVVHFDTEETTKVVRIKQNGYEENLEMTCPSVSSLCGTGLSFYYVGSSPTEAPKIHFFNANDKSDTMLLTSMDPEILKPLRSVLSVPRRIKFPSEGGIGHAYAYFYPARNLFDDSMRPPLLVKTHGGPTSRTSTTLRLDIQFWTSRGFAVLDVDYGGSTGYGKAFCHSLRRNWGVLDINDVCSGALYCVRMGWVDAERLCIDGRSAGGYTTLAALTFRDIFKAGASMCGISNLVTLYELTHKFESRYLDILVGPYPEARDLYNERAPIMHTDQLSCPILLLQGTEDKVVPPDQAEKMFDVLQSKSIKSTLVLYEGEGHHLRKKENIEHALNSEYSFFGKIFGLEVDSDIDIEIGEKIEI